QKISKNAEGLNLREEVSNFRKSFQSENAPEVNVISNGIFGYFTFDAVNYFEDIQLTTPPHPEKDIPTLQYHVYKFVIAIDHFSNQLHIFENLFVSESSELVRRQFHIRRKNFREYIFQKYGAETSHMSDEDFKYIVLKMNEHIQRGDVFQFVPSRGFN